MINEVIKDLKTVDESSKAVYKTYDYIVKAIDILEALKPLEVNDYVSERVLKAFESDNDNDIEVLDSANSYNWGANIDHHMQWHVVKFNNRKYVVMSFHRYGDVRCNYTDRFVLSYLDDNDVNDFGEAIYNNDKRGSVEVDGITYNFYVSALQDYVTVSSEDSNDFEVYPDGLTLEDITKAIKEKTGQ
jgi:hypothetical protein